MENFENHGAPENEREDERSSFAREDFAFLLRVVSGDGTDEEHERALQILGLDKDQDEMPITFSGLLVESLQQEVHDRVQRNRKG